MDYVYCPDANAHFYGENTSYSVIRYPVSAEVIQQYAQPDMSTYQPMAPSIPGQSYQPMPMQTALLSTGGFWIFIPNMEPSNQQTVFYTSVCQYPCTDTYCYSNNPVFTTQQNLTPLHPPAQSMKRVRKLLSIVDPKTGQDLTKEILAARAASARSSDQNSASRWTADTESAAHLNPALCNEGSINSQRELFLEKIQKAKENQEKTYMYMNLENEESKKEENLTNPEEDSGNSLGHNINKTVTDQLLKKNPGDVRLLDKMNLESDKCTVLECHDQIMENDKLKRDTANRHNHFLERDVPQMDSKPFKLVENKYEERLPKYEEEIFSGMLNELPTYGKNKMRDTIPNPLANGHNDFQESSVLASKTLDLVENKYVERLPKIDVEIFPETQKEPLTYVNNKIQDLISNIQKEKQVNHNMTNDVAELYANKEGQGKQDNLGDGPESHLNDVGREAQSKQTKGYHQDDERIQHMERLRAQLSQRNVKRKRRRRRKNGEKTKDESTPSQGKVTVKGKSGFGEAHRGIDENVEKLIQNRDAQKETPHQIEKDKHSTIEIKVDVVSAVTVNSTADVADENDDGDDDDAADDDDGFLPRRLFFFSFSQFKSGERTNY